MNDIAEEALQAHLQGELVTIEEQLHAAFTVIQQYRREDLDRDIDAFAHAEMTENDPLRSTGVIRDTDPFGVRRAFVHSVE